MSNRRSGILFINLGTPDSPDPPAVKRYLAEFLSDPRVIDIPAPARWLLLHGVILRFRPKQSAAAYQQIWTEAGSPLLVHSQALVRAVNDASDDSMQVELGMRYGTPSIGEALDRLIAARPDNLVVLPLFPQWSEAATGSAVAHFKEELEKRGNPLPYQIMGDFYESPHFIDAFAAVARPALENFQPDHVLLSYHGLPERQVSAATDGYCFSQDHCCDDVGTANRRCYRAQCYATSRALVRALALPEGTSSTSFQSRLGRTPWIQPYTDFRLPELAQSGVKRLAVMCPAFVADCLETLEEIAIRATAQWKNEGGEALLLVPSLNAHPRWVRGLSESLREACNAGNPPA